MKELPILFTPEMHRAIRKGRKTETRRLDKRLIGAEDVWAGKKDGIWSVHSFGDPCNAMVRPRYQVGDRLWVKEAICPKAGADGMTMWNADGNTYQVHYRLDDRDQEVIALDDDGGFKFNKDGTMASPWGSPLFMPKWAARTWLDVTGVRAERLQEITEDGAKAEGVEATAMMRLSPPSTFDSYVETYRELWDKINGKSSWQANPWVWVYQFKLLEGRP